MAPQTNYDQAVPAGRAGMAVDAPARIVSAVADELIMPGIPVVAHQTRGYGVCKPPRANVAVILDDGGTWTGGTFGVTINGVTVTTTFATSKAVSMAAVATALQALSFVATAVYTGGSNIITITAEEDVDIQAVTTDVTSLTGTMTITSVTYSNTETFLGLALRDLALPRGTARRVDNDKIVATLSGDTLTTSDTVGGYVNGVAFDTVTYATSEANTLQLLCNALMESPDIYSATYSGRVVTILARPGKDIVVVLTVTDNALASVAPAFAQVPSQQAIPLGENEQAFLPAEEVPIVRRGLVWMRCEELLALGDTLYVRVASGTYDTIGYLRNDTDSGTAASITGMTLHSATTTDSDGNYIAQVEVNLP
jgi:hypothetical protein